MKQLDSVSLDFEKLTDQKLKQLDSVSLDFEKLNDQQLKQHDSVHLEFEKLNDQQLKQQDSVHLEFEKSTCQQLKQHNSVLLDTTKPVRSVCRANQHEEVQDGDEDIDSRILTPYDSLPLCYTECRKQRLKLRQLDFCKVRRSLRKKFLQKNYALPLNMVKRVKNYSAF